MSVSDILLFLLLIIDNIHRNEAVVDQSRTQAYSDWHIGASIGRY